MLAGPGSDVRVWGSYTMRLKTIILLCVIAGPIATFAQYPANLNKNSAKLTGVVTDGSPLTGAAVPLVGAGVAVYEGAGHFAFITGTLSEAPGGSYEIDGLTSGREYFVMFCKEKYVPQSAFVKVPTTPVSKKLIRRNQDTAQWNAVAADFVNYKVTGPADQKAFEKSWDQFLTSGVSAEGKAYVAHDVKDKLSGKPELWNNVKPFTMYADADPTKLNEAERAIWLNTDDPVVISLDPIILQDIRKGKAKVLPTVAWKQLSPENPCSNLGF
jgi:hypothetical protein